MVKEFQEKGSLSYQFGKKQSKSPSRAEAQRQMERFSRTVADGDSSAASGTTQQKSEFFKYLDGLDIEDLHMLTKDRKSSKKNVDGPIIYGAKSPWGKPKVGYSIPRHLAKNPDHLFGLSSYHKGSTSNLQSLLSNEMFREQLMVKVGADMAKRVAMDNMPKRRVENKTSLLRKELAQKRKNEEGLELELPAASSTFSKRSNSQLPPIQSAKNRSTLEGGTPHARRYSYDF